MAGITLPRVIVALLTTFALGLLVGVVGAPPAAAILAGLGALLTALVAMTVAAPEPEPPEPPAALMPDPPRAEPTLEDLMEAIDDPTLLVADRRVLRANPVALDLLGPHIIGEDIRLAIRHPAAAERLVGDNAPDPDPRTTIELTGIGGSGRPWELIIHELSGNARFVRLADRSRTHAAEKMRVDFVANASHELRTPLASLLGYIETLQDVPARDKKTRSRFLEIMQGEASRMQRLIGDLMSLSRIEAERYRLPDEEFALAPVVEQACAAACSTLGDDGSRVVIDGDAAVGTIAGDRAQIAQLVNNLVGNAIKYGRPGTPIAVRYALRPDAIMRLSVADQGEGIAPQHLSRLTERFYRIDAGRSRSMGGTGLGLAIVKHIVERHRGRLRIDSELGKGTEVIVDLPVHPPGLSSRRNESVTYAGDETGPPSIDSAEDGTASS